MEILTYLGILLVLCLAAKGAWVICKSIKEKISLWWLLHSPVVRETSMADGLKIGDTLIDEAYEKWCDDYDAEVDGFEIAGINYRNLDSSHLGEFKGYVKLEPTNPHDSRAIAIYSGRKKVGYIPRMDTGLIYESVQANGGKQSCIGFIHTFINEFHEERFAGKVIVGPKPYLEPKRGSLEV